MVQYATRSLNISILKIKRVCVCVYTYTHVCIAVMGYVLVHCTYRTHVYIGRISPTAGVFA